MNINILENLADFFGLPWVKQLFWIGVGALVCYYVNIFYPKISRQLRLWSVNRSCDGIEGLIVHGSPRKNIFTLRQLKSAFNGEVSINIDCNESGISLASYDTKMSPMYLLTSFPVKLIFPLPLSENTKDKLKWEERGVSNSGFGLKAVSEIAAVNEIILN